MHSTIIAGCPGGINAPIAGARTIKRCIGSTSLSSLSMWRPIALTLSEDALESARRHASRFSWDSSAAQIRAGCEWAVQHKRP